MSRYIDADKLMSEFHRYAWDTEYLPIDLIEDIVNDEPTADVRENVKGEWIEKKPMSFGRCVNGLGSIFKCSVCGEEILCCTTNYCPNCGADMMSKS